MRAAQFLVPRNCNFQKRKLFFRQREHWHVRVCIRTVTTRQAGADQLFGSYPSRADLFSSLTELDHFVCFPSCHGIVDVLRDPICGGEQRRIDLMDIALGHARAGVANQSFDGWKRIAKILRGRAERMAQTIARNPGHLFGRYFLKPPG